MSNSKFFVFFFFISFASSSFSSFNNTHRCSIEQSRALFTFKQNIFSYYDDYVHYRCHDRLGSDYHPIMMNWNTSTDCCNWNGVTCSHFNGDVIGLDLSCGMLRGTIHPNTTLFNLPHLERLNLAFNYFYLSQLPREIGRLSNSLTHLNISYCWFIGQVPTDITLLHKLVSLDLSFNSFDVRLEPHVLNNLLQNSTLLKDLSLADVNISLVLPTYLNISSSLKSLDLHHTGLKGKLPQNIFDLQYMETLQLSRNDFTGRLPKVNTSANIPLKHLDVSYNKRLLGEIPSSIGHLKSLNYLDLSYNEGLSGEIPSSIGHLKSLNYLDLSNNEGLSGEIPSSIGRLKSLNYLVLSYNINLSGEIPSSIGCLKSLNYLDLSGNINLSGEIPSSVGCLKSLNYLDLSGNINLSGEIPSSIGHLKSLNYFVLLNNEGLSGEIPYSIGDLKSLNTLIISDCGFMGPLPKSMVNLRHLTALFLYSNKLNGTLPSWLFTLPSLEYIDLHNNMFHGSLPLKVFNHQSLKELNLGNNQLDDEIDVLETIRQLTTLTDLDLSYNSFKGDLELETLLSSLKNLAWLDLSYSGLSVLTYNDNRYINPHFRYLSLGSCKLTVFPESLRAMKNLWHLDLSSNEIHGRIPDWAGEIGGNKLSYLNLSHNFIEGLPQLRWHGLQQLYLQSNKIQGSFPPSICNISNLDILDMSDNSFGGVIPHCFGNISSSLYMVDLGNNSFHGTIPNSFENCRELQGLILNKNQFEGEVPSSLSKCQHLKVLNLGGNLLNGTFPGWLGDLPALQVLDLKSNHFHGPIETSSTRKVSFPCLLVLDLSQNQFAGHLPKKYFQSFNAMKNVVKNHEEPSYLRTRDVYYSISVDVKGVEQNFPQIFVHYTIVDLSNNRFEGEIPDIICKLNSLIVLDLSHNNLIGRIPPAVGSLSDIESLDLSCNQLTGDIPQSLADLTFLAFLNLSQNHLTGRIPTGNQFNTFPVEAFGGNPRLCGLPLPEKCEHPHEPPVEDEDTENGLSWKVVMLGYGCGVPVGLVMGYLMLSTGRPKWFNAIVDAGEDVIKARKSKRRYVYIGK